MSRPVTTHRHEGAAAVRTRPVLEISTDAYYWKPMAAYFGALELAAFRAAGVRLAGPVLDLGCGDGLSARMLGDQGSIDGACIGLDRDRRSTRRAARTGAFAALVDADATRLPLRTGSVPSVVCNGVLNAIPELDAALGEIRRVLSPGGRLAACVPTDRFPTDLPIVELLRHFGERASRRHLDEIVRRCGHRHQLPIDEWRARFGRAGLEVVGEWGFLSAHERRVWDLLFVGAWRALGILRLPGLATLRPFWATTERRLLAHSVVETPIPRDDAGYVLLVAIAGGTG
jgi:SAM-dependent methyltransferase